MRGLFVLMFAAALAGCDNSDVNGIKTAVKERLIDPDSVKFGNTRVGEAGVQACIEYNAKNRMGGYNGQKIASLSKSPNGWRVWDMDVSPDSCPIGKTY
nr:hypothetical protein [uncultured Limnohabitans sp.]